jgi:hypothetical protein
MFHYRIERWIAGRGAGFWAFLGVVVGFVGGFGLGDGGLALRWVGYDLNA